MHRTTVRDLLAVSALAGVAVTLVSAGAGCPGWLSRTTGAAEREPQTSATQNAEGRTMETATFGAGCFWGVEAKFRRVDGVTDTAVGYSGGHAADPTYEQVCTGRTGHAEVVKVTFDPGRVTYAELLEEFWECHDPTQRDRQGPDIGTQYRSLILYHSPEQERVARESLKARQDSGEYRRPIATEITAAGPFWRAEEYHQRYLEKRGLETCGY